MFRLTQTMQYAFDPASAPAVRTPKAPVVIWNQIRRCNLTCKHCYSTSADIDFAGELSTAEVAAVMNDLKAYGVPYVIVSGGEPLMRPDWYELACYAKSIGLNIGLSTNGTLIDDAMAQKIRQAGFSYVGISLDGLQARHDAFRQLQGAFHKSLNALRYCMEAGLSVGARFTLTEDNAGDLEPLMDMLFAEGVRKFYLSHLNYAGRGNRNRKTDAYFQTTRKALDMLFQRAYHSIKTGDPIEFVTGNNDADAGYFLQWVERHMPDQYNAVFARLQQWGGNASGQHVANIDNLGNVHPDTFWWDHQLGNVRERNFSDIWREPNDQLMAEMRQKPRPVKGRCADCRYVSVCGGNTRVRAAQLYNDPWAEDPGCYLSDDDIGVSGQVVRLHPLAGAAEKPAKRKAS